MFTLKYCTPLRNMLTRGHRSLTRRLRIHLFRAIAGIYRLRIDDPITNADGISGLCLVASYTDKDKGYLHGLIESCAAFEKVLLYHDARASHDFRFNESLRFQLLVASAKRVGATWVLIGSPKTRFSSEFKDQISPFLSAYTGTRTVLALKERYLWEDFDHYALPDSVKGDLMIKKLFSITDRMLFDGKPIHAKQCPTNYTTIVNTPASRYYLGRFSLAAMQKKADFYHKLDGKDYSHLSKVSSPKLHGEKLLGLGDYEREQLIGSARS